MNFGEVVGEEFDHHCFTDEHAHHRAAQTFRCSRSNARGCILTERHRIFLLHSYRSVTLVQHRPFIACIFFLTSFFINSIQSSSCNK